jgi:hypothetical protein
MKKVLVLLFVLQSTGNVVAQMPSGYEREIAGKKTGDDKANFSSILNALGKFTSQDEATITFQPTLYGIVSMVDPKIREQNNFIKATFLRNFQLNLGISPSETSIFEIDNFQSGFSYAILNNKKLKKKEYDALVASDPAIQNLGLYLAALGEFVANHPNTAAGEQARLYAEKGLSEEAVKEMNDTLKVYLKNKLGVSTDAELVNMETGLNKAFDQLLTELSKRTLLTVEFKSTYDFTDTQWGKLAFTPVNLYCYFNKKKLSSPGLNAKLNYVMSTDTTTKEALKRSSLETEVGMNFPIKVNPETEKARFEIKPGVSYKYIAQRLYKDENRSKLDPTLTLRIRINDDFYLPLKFEYDTENAELFGFLSIQFSLN